MNNESESSKLKKTALHALHMDLGARMVPFAGYQMPVQYSLGIIKEHCHTRRHAGLFDISHMGQIKIKGDNVAGAFEQLVPSDISGLSVHKQIYTVLTNEQGGIIDDCMVTNCGDSLFLVVNATRKERVLEHLRSNLKKCDVTELNNRALVAIQGPEATKVMERLAPKVIQLPFMCSGVFAINGTESLVSRCGYTGEDGFEISLASDQVDALARLFISQNEVEPIGLGARDSLRLEAGLCLYGHDIDEDISPIEAGLEWVVAKSYRLNARPACFPGAERILRELRDGPGRKRIGLQPEGKTLAREGAPLFDAEGEKIGHITSGGFGPSIEGPIAMAIVRAELARPDAKFNAMIRKRLCSVTVVPLPFIPHRYFRN